ncbi:type II toxin-antitoxin system RelE/ParE family toxin [Sphingosinicella terrae]|uniref:type II toxin-antitoxin system RelE/ParE family toxin n=1 Tax=Sphingosinicella terrae TaxID=2172047 RepID=UPI0013B433CA|nr:type II toxin-antitoxin system RelE/ParE family toxin [Sphingosinicella terrae]
MAEVRLRTAAAADLSEILEYSVARFGRTVGEDYLRSFEKSFALLGRHPRAGVRIDVTPAINCLPHRSHRILYDLDDETVRIVRDLHHSMDAEHWLSE